MKVGVLTYHKSHNYGAFLQAYALAKWLQEELEIEVEIINYNSISAEIHYIKQVFRAKNVKHFVANIRRFKIFNTSLKWLPLSDKKIISEKYELIESKVLKKYNYVIVGSDEVWKLGFRGFPNAYWLPFDTNIRKISYAASSRSDFNTLTSTKKNIFIKLLNQFDYVGVRDKATYEEMSKYLASKDKLFYNCDPTFNYEFDVDIAKIRSILSRVKKFKVSKRSILFMYSDNKTANEIMNRLGDDYNYLSIYDYIEGTINLNHFSPFEWISLIAFSDYMITTYFHGMCFAIKNNVPFSIVEKRKTSKENSKSFDLLCDTSKKNKFNLLHDECLIDNIVSSVKSDLENMNYSSFDIVRKERLKAESIIAYFKNEKLKEMR